MSFMPSPGARVRMRDGRLAIVTKVTPDGEDDRVRFDNGHEKHVTPWDIEEVLDDELEASRNLEPDCPHEAVGAGKYTREGKRLPPETDPVPNPAPTEKT